MKDPIPRIAVFTPTQAELVGPLRSLRGASVIREGPLLLAAGTLHGVETVLVRTGIGPMNSRAAADRVFTGFTVKETLVAGFGGATTMDVGVGDLIGCSELLDLTEKTEWEDEPPPRLPCSPSLMERAQRTGVLRKVGCAATVSRVITSAEEKRSLGKRFDTVVVEMEGFPILEKSRVCAVPAVMMRAVLDAAGEDLPNTADLVTDTGVPRAGKVLKHLVSRPGDAVLLSSFRRRVKACRRVLDDFLERYLRSV